eukprot:193121-Alexandrium_andersonii.AAC.1
MHACVRHDLSRLANVRRGVQAAEESRSFTAGSLGQMLSSQSATLQQLEEEEERAVTERDQEEAERCIMPPPEGTLEHYR